MKILNIFNRSKSRKDLAVLNRVNSENIQTPRRTFGMSGGTYVSGDTSMQASAFYRGVIYISTQIAKIPWEVKDSNNKVLNNELSYLLNVSPNEEMTAFHAKLFLIQCAIVDGNGYAEIERSIDGRVKAIWPLNPKRVRPIRSLDGKLFYEVVSGSHVTDTVYLAAKDVFVVRSLHTRDGITGEGVVAYAMETLGISLGADRFANALFSNGGLPSGVLSHPGTLSDEAYARLSSSWKDQHGGRKTGGTAILEEGVAYNPISHSPDVLQFLESRKFNVIEIARFLGIPPTMLFDSESAKFNNVENQNLQVVIDVLDSWARNLESEADMKLLSGRKGDRRTEFDLYAVFRGDMETRSNYFKSMMSIGAMTPNEIRISEGLAAYPGGDRYFISVNNLSPSDRIDEIIDAQVKPKPTPTPSVPVNETDKVIADYLIEKTKISR